MSNVNRNDSNAAELEEVRIGGKAYHAAPTIGKAEDAHPRDFPLCAGCAGDGDDVLCATLPSCTRPQVIWVAK